MARFHGTENGLIPYTAEEEAEADAELISAAWMVARARRNALLAESDHVTLRAYSRGEPVPEQWAAYMQALRDITNQPNPLALAWPTKPT